MTFSKKSGVKIPKEITVLYDQKRNRLMCVGPLGSKIILLHFKLYITFEQNYIFVITNLTKKRTKDNIKSLSRTLQARLKQLILELTIKLNKTLKMIGVGFKTYSMNIENTHVLQFKLGFSHFIYFKVPQDIKLTTLKNTKIFLSNPHLERLTQIAANIKSLKYPEIYKGKGILYDREKIVLKKGKKIT